jgi:tetratricopeptide (TPR) repeat protein
MKILCNPLKIVKPVVLMLLLLIPVIVAASSSSDLLRQGDVFYEDYDKDAGNLDRAIEHYKMVIEKGEKDAIYDAYWKTATVYWTLGKISQKPEEGLDHYLKGSEAALKGMDIYPNRPESHFWYFACLGKISELKGKANTLIALSKLRKHINRALEIDPDYVFAVYGKAILLKKIPSYLGGDLKKSETLFKRVIELDPNFSNPYIELAKLYIEENREVEAKTLLVKVINMENPSWEANWNVFNRPAAKRLLGNIEHKVRLSLFLSEFDTY